MPSISRSRAVAYAVAVLVLLLLGGRFLLHDEPQTGRRHDAPAAMELESEPAKPRRIVVHVVGAVHDPGLFELDEGSRVDDAIQLAGGAKPKAALELVNLAAPVADGQQVVVPARGRSGSAEEAVGDGASVGAGGRVHLNSATLEELDGLPGIGPVTAQKILDYRTSKGAFGSVSELDAVPGIGPTRLAELEELVDL